ncbi:hypothetical protein EDC01DRAFT_727327 [Geopyxis carbonaria]|nr:hypothetical protein EDC01DRAFT_727327 [Geopyxis carbonaria]
MPASDSSSSSSHYSLLHKTPTHFKSPYADDDELPLPRRRRWWWPWSLHLLAFVAYILVATVISIFFFRCNCSDGTGCESREKELIYSPAWDAVEYETVKFKGGFWLETVYKGKPRPELEQAWSDLIQDHIIAIPPSALPQLNMTPATTVYYPESGDVVAGLNVFHQLHCLNLVRKYTWGDYYKDKGDKSWSDPPDTLRMHIDHCIDILRQKLTCDGDVGVGTYKWVKDRDAMMPDFSNVHRCRRVGPLQDWVKARRMQVPVIEKPPGQQEELKLD